MSDNWIVLIPENPSFVPEAKKQLRARERFSEIAPDADQIELKVCKKIQFFDCGANFERILCPSCSSEISVAWWRDRMNEDWNDGWSMLVNYATPCCNSRHNLNELVYEWPQGFARFGISAMNPQIGRLDDRHRRELEGILGTELRVIYQHL